MLLSYGGHLELDWHQKSVSWRRTFNESEKEWFISNWRLVRVFTSCFCRASTCPSWGPSPPTPTRRTFGSTWCASSTGTTSSWSWATTTRAVPLRRGSRPSWRKGKPRWEALAPWTPDPSLCPQVCERLRVCVCVVSCVCVTVCPFCCLDTSLSHHCVNIG